MEVDNIFKSYYEGKINELNSTLKEHVNYFAETGDIVMLSRAFSYYGALNLICSNDYYVSTLYKQISEEYNHAGDDPRIKASYARFLGLYSSFSGKNEDAGRYYSDAIVLYSQTDWYMDEAIALLESVCWYYLFSDAGDGFYRILERLEALNNYLDGYILGDLIILRSICRENNFISISYPGILEKIEGHRISMPLTILLSFISLRDDLLNPDKSIGACKTSLLSKILDSSFVTKQICPVIQLLQNMAELVHMVEEKNYSDIDMMMNSLKAKGEILRHHWYKNQLSELQSYLRSINNNQGGLYRVILQGINHPAYKIYVSVFEKCQLSYGNTAVNLSSFGTRMGNELLLYLLTRSNLQVHKEVLVELFFPGEEPEKAYNRLYVNIHRLNKALRKHFTFSHNNDFVFIKQGVVCLNPDDIEEIDLHNFRKMLSVANQLWIHDKDGAVEIMSKAVSMYSSHIAPGFYYLDWLDDYRLELKNMQLKALYRIFQYYKDRNDSKKCSEAFGNLVELDPLNEEYYIEYIDYIIKDGRGVEALSLFNQYQARLKRELGLVPSIKLKNLMSQTMR